MKVAITSITTRRIKIKEMIKMRKTTMVTLIMIWGDDKTKTAVTSIMTKMITMKEMIKVRKTTMVILIMGLVMKNVIIHLYHHNKNTIANNNKGELLQHG